MKKGVAAFLVWLILPSICFAQSATGSAGSTDVLDRNAWMVEIGPLRGPAALEFRHPEQVLHSGQSQAQPNAHHGHPVLIGVAIGAGAGYLINATACRTGEGVCTFPGNMLMAGIGAGIGALVGVLISRH
jgi:hypothetical protein